jgi:hypothetical protein
MLNKQYSRKEMNRASILYCLMAYLIVLVLSIINSDGETLGTLALVAVPKTAFAVGTLALLPYGLRYVAKVVREAE